MTISTFLGFQIYGNNIPQTLKRTSDEQAVAQAQAYFNANIGKVKTVSDLVNNYRLLSYATKAFGLGDMTSAKALLTQVLTSDLTSHTSVANKLNDSRYVAFARAFGFDTKGNLKAPLQTTAQQAATEALFLAKTTLGASAAAAATKSYETAMASIISVGQLEQNSAALGYVLIAYGIDPNTAAASLEKTLESDLSDPKSFVNQQPDSGFTALAGAFNSSPDGSSSQGTVAQTAEEVSATTDAYMGKIASDTASQTTAKTETSYFTSKIASVTSVSQLVADKRLVAYVTKAFGLPSDASAASISQALTSNLSSKTSYANSSPFPAYLNLAKAFNFTTAGVAAAVPFQSVAQQQSTVELYMERQTSGSSAADAATAYYQANIGAVKSVSDLQNDPALLKYVLTAYGIDAATPASTVAAVIEKSTSVDKGYLGLAQSFSVASDGSPLAISMAQTSTNQKATVAAYLKTFASDAASQKSGTTEANYFLSQIPSIVNASSLVSDSRLLAFVVKAFGLPPQTAASDVQRALTSDTMDAASFASTRGGGFLTMAKAFNFETDGNTGTTSQLQTDQQQQTIAALYADRTSSSSKDAAAASAYYRATIGKMTSVADLVADPKMLNYVVTAYGLDANTSASTISALLQNTGGIVDTYKSLAGAFTINLAGATQAVAQTAANVNATISAYKNSLSSSPAVQAAAAADAQSYAAKIATIKSADDFTADASLVSFVKAAFGLPADATPTTIKQALTSDLSSSRSFANAGDASYLALAKAFNFSPAGTPQLQTTAQQQSAEQLFAANTTGDADATAAATAYYKATIATVQSITDLQSDPKILAYLGTAYGVDLTTSKTTVASILDSTHGVLDTSKGSSLLALKNAFTIDAQGRASTGYLAQSTADVTATTAAYLSAAGTSKSAQTAASGATIYYKSAIAKVTSASDLLSDPKLVAYLKTAYNIPAKTTNATLLKVITSNIADPKSTANAMGANYAQLAAALNFGTTGLIAPQAVVAASRSQLNTINSAYIEQQMETEAGAQNPGIALALYFQANASKVTDAYSILADKKLTVIFQTMLNLPATASGADIDAQAKTITKNFNLADLKDPVKLKNLIQRFSVFYDLNPPKSTAKYTDASVLTGSTDTLDVSSLFAPTSNDS